MHFDLKAKHLRVKSDRLAHITDDIAEFDLFHPLSLLLDLRKQARASL